MKLDGQLNDPRSRKVLVMEILGVEPSRVPHGPPYQTVEGAEVRVLESTADAALVALPDERVGWVSWRSLASTDPAAPFPAPATPSP